MKKEFLNGCRAGIPVVLGYVPVAIAYAIMAMKAGLSTAETVLMSITVYAGAAQMMSTHMLLQSAPVVTIITATFVLNFRHLIMSTVVMNDLRNQPLPFRLVASFFLTDESFALYTSQERKHPSGWYYLGAALVAYCSWVFGSLIGTMCSSLMPAILSASFGVALYAMFIALLVPTVKTGWKMAALAVLSGLLNCLFMQFMESSWALIASALLAAAIGCFVIDPKGESHES